MTHRLKFRKYRKNSQALTTLKLGSKRKREADAVREGYAMATGDILMILDADLTVPPEDLPKFTMLLPVVRRFY